MKRILLPLAVAGTLVLGNQQGNTSTETQLTNKTSQTIEDVCVEHLGILDKYVYDGQVNVTPTEGIEETGNSKDFYGIGTNQAEALEDALKKGVEYFHGAHIKAETEMRDYLITKDRIESYSNGAISRAEVLDTLVDKMPNGETVPGLYSVLTRVYPGNGNCPTNLK